jgi:hypothetical protein
MASRIGGLCGPCACPPHFRRSCSWFVLPPPTVKNRRVLPEGGLRPRTALVVIDPDAGEPLGRPQANAVARDRAENPCWSGVALSCFRPSNQPTLSSPSAPGTAGPCSPRSRGPVISARAPGGPPTAPSASEVSRGSLLPCRIRLCRRQIEDRRLATRFSEDMLTVYRSPWAIFTGFPAGVALYRRGPLARAKGSGGRTVSQSHRG